MCSNYLQEVKEYTKDAISDSIVPELTDEIVASFDVEKAFTYQVGFDVQPTLSWKSPYKGLKVTVAKCPVLAACCVVMLGDPSNKRSLQTDSLLMMLSHILMYLLWCADGIGICSATACHT